MATDQTAKRVFLGLLALSFVLLALLVRPFAEALFLAAVLAGAFHRICDALARRLRGWRGLAAGLICFGVVMALLLPLAGLTAFLVAQVVEGIEYISKALESGGVEGLVERLPGPLQDVTGRMLARLRIEGRSLGAILQQQLQERGATAAGAVTGAITMTGTLLFQAAMMLIALFFLLKDGRRLVAWLERVSPLRPGQTPELLREFRAVSVAVLSSSLVTAGVQALVALVGFLIARVPVPLFFTALAFVLALVPAVGASVGVLAAAALLLIGGRPWAALFLAIWGIVVVGLSDNVVKPLLVKRGLHMHGAVVFFALIGGLAAFGPIGLVAGPLVVSFFLAVVRIYERDFKRAGPPPRDPTAPPEHQRASA